MDLSLVLTYAEQNDNKAVILTDTTTNWNSTTTAITNGEDTINKIFMRLQQKIHWILQL